MIFKLRPNRVDPDQSTLTESTCFAIFASADDTAGDITLRLILRSD